MTAPGTTPTAMKMRSSARSDARRAMSPATTSAAMMTAAIATASQRTTRPRDEMQQGVEVERDEGGRHGVGSVSGARRRGGRRRSRRVGWPTPAVSPTGSSGGHGADIIGPWLVVARGRAAGLGGDTRRRILGGPPARARRPAHGGTGRASRADTERDTHGTTWNRTASPPAGGPAGPDRSPNRRRGAGRLRGPPRSRPVRPAGPRPPSPVARGDRRGPVARIRHAPRPARCARPSGSSATASRTLASRRIRCSTSRRSRSASEPA